MSRLQQVERELLLSALAQMGSQGRAENERGDTFRRTYYPVPEHLRAFDPDVVLVIGPRGAGKSELFRAAVQEKLLPAVVRTAPSPRLLHLDPGQAEWLPAHPVGKEFADQAGLRRFLGSHAGDADAEIQLWFAYLARVLRKSFPDLQFRDSALLELPGGDIDGIVEAFRSLGNEPLLALDRLDNDLAASKRLAIVGYDELDLLGAFDWQAMVRSIRGLVAFWANYARRWTRIRAKIFLRTDLFRRHAQSFGADLAKLAANRVEIAWSDRNLYAMLIKRIANSGDGLRQYVREAKIKFRPEDEELGLIPVLEKASDASPFVEKLVGQYMGANVRKGRTFYWLLSHVRDGNGQAVPRALVRLIEEAASQEQNRPLAARSRLLDQRSLRRALDAVSRAHVLDVNTHELPWLHGVTQRIGREGVPMPRREAIDLLGRDWSGSWSETACEAHPPVETPSSLVDYLLELGIFRMRADQRIDVPDLFLAGLGLTRKGGVRKK